MPAPLSVVRNDAVLGDGEYVTVEQLAALKGIGPHAVRKLLRAGVALKGEYTEGRRTSWRIPVAEARRYLGLPVAPGAPPSAAGGRVDAGLDAGPDDAPDAAPDGGPGEDLPAVGRTVTTTTVTTETFGDPPAPGLVVGAPAGTGPVPDPAVAELARAADRAAELEAENARLRRQLAELRAAYRDLQASGQRLLAAYDAAGDV